jgi:hypothetical protein
MLMHMYLKSQIGTGLSTSACDPTLCERVENLHVAGWSEYRWGGFFPQVRYLRLDISAGVAVRSS